MNTIDIANCLKEIARNKFEYGVYANDRLPLKLKKPAIIVANTDPSYKPGTHWIAFYLPKRGIGEYFDSYGRTPIDKNFVRFLKLHCKKFKFNNKQLQSDLSTLCGNYCCVYLYYKTKNMSMDKFLKKFKKDNHVLNDKKVKRMFKKHFKKKTQVGSGGEKLECNQSCKPLKYKRM